MTDKFEIKAKSQDTPGNVDDKMLIFDIIRGKDNGESINTTHKMSIEFDTKTTTTTKTLNPGTDTTQTINVPVYNSSIIISYS